jgi:hypothetical protein
MRPSVSAAISVREIHPRGTDAGLTGRQRDRRVPGSAPRTERVDPGEHQQHRAVFALERGQPLLGARRWTVDGGGRQRRVEQQLEQGSPVLRRVLLGDPAHGVLDRDGLATRFPGTTRVVAPARVGASAAILGSAGVLASAGILASAGVGAATAS